MTDRIARALAGAALVLVVLAFTPLGSAVGNAVTPAARSVGTAQLKTGAVTRPKLKPNAVGTVQVQNGSLKARDFAPGQLPAGPAGPAGAAGAAGAAGPAGNNSLIGFANVKADGTIRSFGGNGTTSVTVTKTPTYYDVTFNGTYPAGTTSHDKIASFAAADTDFFDVASTSLDASPVPTPTKVTIRVFIFRLTTAPPTVIYADFAVQILAPTS